MATIKLKDVLKSLPIDASLSGGEKIVINDDGENKYIPYSAIKQGLVTDKERTTLTNTADWLIGHNNLESIDAMNTELDAFNGDTAQGLHRLRCWGIPFLVTFSVLNKSDKVYMQVIQGSLTFISDKTKIASINTASNYTIAVRYYANSKWTEWKTPIPSLQSGAKGTSNNYIYSNSGDNTHAALSGTFNVFQNSGKCYVRHKFWGSTNDYNDGQYTTCEFPAVNTSANGCMEAAMLVRLRNSTIYEGSSTTESMVVLYPNYADGSTKTLTLTKATTAKAGVMTATDKTLLSALGGYLHPVTDNLTTLDALNTKLNGMGASTEQGTHYFKCFGIPLTVTLSVLNVDNKVLMQTITGSITLNADNTALGSINGTGNYTTAVRYYQNNKWGKWSMPLNPPTAQTGASGTKASYIYSAGSDQDTKTLVTSKFWIYQHNDRNKFLRFKHWGANNDTEEENYSQVMLPNVWIGGNGLMRWDVYKRLDAFELREQNSTATEVKIVTPIFTTGGTRELSISAATTAKAGVMTAADRELLNKIKAKLGL